MDFNPAQLGAIPVEEDKSSFNPEALGAKPVEDKTPFNPVEAGAVPVDEEEPKKQNYVDAKVGPIPESNENTQKTASDIKDFAKDNLYTPKGDGNKLSTLDTLKETEKEISGEKPSVPIADVEPDAQKKILEDQKLVLAKKYAKEKEIESRDSLDTIKHATGEFITGAASEASKIAKDPIAGTADVVAGGALKLASEAERGLGVESNISNLSDAYEQSATGKDLNTTAEQTAGTLGELGVPRADTPTEKALAIGAGLATPLMGKGIRAGSEIASGLATEGKALGNDVAYISKNIISKIEATGTDVRPTTQTSPGLDIPLEMVKPELVQNLPPKSQDYTPLTDAEDAANWSNTVTNRYKLVDDVINGQLTEDAAKAELSKTEPENPNVVDYTDSKLLSLQNGAVNYLNDPDSLQVILSDIDKSVTDKQVDKLITPFNYESNVLKLATNFKTNVINKYNTLQQFQKNTLKNKYETRNELKEQTGDFDTLYKLSSAKLEALDSGQAKYVHSKLNGNAEGNAQGFGRDKETGELIYESKEGLRAFTPIISDINKAKIDQTYFDIYLQARDAVDQLSRNAERDVEGAYRGFNTFDEALKIVEDGNKNPVMKKAAEDMHRLARSTIEDMVETGRLSRGEADDILNAHPNYVGILYKRPDWLTPELQESLGISVRGPNPRNTLKLRTGVSSDETYSAIGSIRQNLIRQSREASDNAIRSGTVLDIVRKLTPEQRGRLFPGWNEDLLAQGLGHYRLSQEEGNIFKTEIMPTLPGSSKEYLDRIAASSLNDKAKKALSDRVGDVQKIVQRNLEEAASQAGVDKKYAVANFLDRNGNPIAGQPIPDETLKAITEQVQGFLSDTQRRLDVDMTEEPGNALSFFVGGNKYSINTASNYVAQLLQRKNIDVGTKGLKNVSRFISRNLTTGPTAIKIFLREAQDLPMFGAGGVNVYPFENIKTLYQMLATDNPKLKSYAKELEDTYALGGKGRFSDIQADGKNIDNIDEQISENRLGKLKSGEATWDYAMKGLDIWDNAFDNATRLTIYKKARESGLSRMEATVLANKTGVDFSQTGLNSKAVNTLRLIPFLYTSMKSADRVLSLGINHPARLGKAVGEAWAFSKLIDLWNNQQLDEDGNPIMDQLPENRKMRSNLILKPGAKSINDAYDVLSGFVVGPEKEVVNTGFNAVKTMVSYMDGRLDSAVEESALDMLESFKTEGITDPQAILQKYKKAAEDRGTTLGDFVKTLVIAQMNVLALPTQAPVISAVVGLSTGVDPLTGRPFTQSNQAPSKLEQDYNPINIPPYFIKLSQSLGGALPGATPAEEWFVLSNSFYNGFIKTIAETVSVPFMDNMPEGYLLQNLPIVSPQGRIGEYTKDRNRASTALARVTAIQNEYNARKANYEKDPTNIDKALKFENFQKEFGDIVSSASMFDDFKAGLKDIDNRQKLLMEDESTPPHEKTEALKSMEKEKSAISTQIIQLYSFGNFMSDKDIDLMYNNDVTFGPVLQSQIEKVRNAQRFKNADNPNDSVPPNPEQNTSGEDATSSPSTTNQ